MDEGVVASVLAEREDLLRKLDAVEKFLAVYGRDGAKPVARPSVKRVLARSFADRIDKFGVYGQSVINGALKHLPSVDGEPVLTRDLVTMLDDEGIAIRGENKVNALSALLARSSQIKGHGRNGWTRNDPVHNSAQLTGPVENDRNDTGTSSNDSGVKPISKSGDGWGDYRSPPAKPFAEDDDDSEIPF